ncbi:MAG: sensor histidine kinase [Kofleriaceae bacterium]
MALRGTSSSHRTILVISIVIGVVNVLSLVADPRDRSNVALLAVDSLHAMIAFAVAHRARVAQSSWSDRTLELVFALITAPFLAGLWLPQSFATEVAVDPLLASRLLLLGLAVAAPTWRSGAIALGVFTGHAVALWLVLVAPATSFALDREPWFTLFFAGIAAMLLYTREHRRDLERRLEQSHRLEAIGRLAAGVAHEINTPLQFAGDSVRFTSEVAGDLMSVIETQQALVASVLRDNPEHAEALEARAALERADVDYIRDEVPAALERATEGLSRVAGIVRSMKQFAHHGGETTNADLGAAIQDTLTIARNEYRFVADVDLSLGELPTMECRLGEINQVLLAIVINAAQAIREKVGTSEARGTIGVRACVRGELVEISISDTGKGIPPEVQNRIFEPFFTTKEVGSGTGQGLAIARTVIERHGGTIDFKTTPGRGTTFFVRLPIRQSTELKAA